LCPVLWLLGEHFVSQVCWSLAVQVSPSVGLVCLGMDWVGVVSFFVGSGSVCGWLVCMSVGCVAGMPITPVVSTSNLMFF